MSIHEPGCMWAGVGCSGALIVFGDVWLCEKHFPTGAPLPAPGVRERSEAALKFDKGKLRLELIDPVVTNALASILTKGAVKYGAHNWMKGFEWSRIYGALQRHLNAWYNCEGLDEEMQESHLHNAICCLSFLISHETRGLGTDDRPFGVESLDHRPEGPRHGSPSEPEAPWAAVVSSKSKE